MTKNAMLTYDPCTQCFSLSVDDGTIINTTHDGISWEQEKNIKDVFMGK